MAAYARGDPRAFGRLYRSLGPLVHGFFLRTVRDPDLARDLAQTTFLKLHLARESYQPDRPLRPWVFTIASRVRLDELRRRRRAPRPDDTVAWAQAWSDQDRPEIVLDVRAGLNALSPAARRVVLLHRVEGRTCGEIAEMLGASEGAVRLRAFRAVRRLRALLAPVWWESRRTGGRQPSLREQAGARRSR